MEFVAPQTTAQEIVAGIWSQLLGVERVGIHDNFFMLGGHSMLAVNVNFRLREAFLVDLPLRTLFETPTVAGVVDAIAKLWGDAEVVEKVAQTFMEVAQLSKKTDGVVPSEKA